MKHLKSLDSMRGLAALSVVAQHIFQARFTLPMTPCFFGWQAQMPLYYFLY